MSPKLNETEEVRVESLEHHGITAGYIDKLKLVERIDARLPMLKEDEAKLTHGQRVKAMIINGLGFTQNPIYLSPHFFENKALSILIGKGVEAEHINADSLGRALDRIYDYGTTQLFAEIANEISKEFLPATSRQHLHLDTTSLKVCGEYDVEARYVGNDTSPPLPKYGHSKDHRPDLKQLMLSLTVSGPASLPVWFEGLDGNSQDKSNFHHTLEQIKIFRSLLEESPDVLVIADSALYVKDKLNDALYAWITRVPENIKLVKQLVESNEQEFSWQKLQDDYTGVWLGAVDRGMRQHWVMVYSEQANKRETITLNKRIDKALLTGEKEVKKLANQSFACEKDAWRAAVAFEKKLKYHKLTCEIAPVTKFTSRGRPKKTELPVLSHYQVQIKLHECLEKQQPYRNKLGRFILATNDLTNQEMDASSLLNIYKEQQGVERGFRFIKDPQFHLHNIFLKKPERIDALMMIMTLCLMVYNVGQYEIREELIAQDETVLNQVGKPTQTPTLRWLFQRMNGINLVIIPGQRACVTGLTEEKKKILRLFGKEVAQLYRLA
jgi:transposase